MGAAAYRRGSENIRRQIAEEQAAKQAEPVHFWATQYEAERQRRTDIETENARLRARLELVESRYAALRASSEIAGEAAFHQAETDLATINHLRASVRLYKSKWGCVSWLLMAALRRFATPETAAEFWADCDTDPGYLRIHEVKNTAAAEEARLR